MSKLDFYMATSEQSKINQAITELKLAHAANKSNEVNAKIISTLEVLATAVNAQADLWDDMQREMRKLSSMSRGLR